MIIKLMKKENNLLILLKLVKMLMLLKLNKYQIK